MAYAACMLLALMLFSTVTGILQISTAQAQETRSNELVIRVEKIVPSLGTELEDWCGVTFEFLPDGRMICGELRSGKIRLIENNTLAPDPPLIDLDVFAGWKAPNIFDEQGLVGLAIDPNFQVNGHVYVHYTYIANVTSNETERRVARYTLVDDRLIDEKVLLEGIPAAKQHIGGPLEFGPDGKLYITGGEAGKRARADDLRSPLGKILRINPDGSIPADNPFPGEPYYTIGHRNVFGITFHPLTERPYITENGNQTNDEINILYPGKHYGWPHVNGTTNDPKYVSPVYATGPGTIAPTEAEFYTGDKYAEEFVNDLFILAYNTRSLERIELVGPDNDIMTSYTSYPLPNTFPGSYTDIELGPDGYFYVSDFKSISRILFDQVNATSNIVMTGPETTETAQATTLSAKITDDNQNPLTGIPLSFVVSGNVIGAAETNNDGVASILYTPLSAGEFAITARFAGNEKFAPNTSAEVILQVEGPSTSPPQILEARTADNFLVRLTILPSGDQTNNSTMKFAVSIVDPRSQTELPGIPYHVDILRGDSVLFSRDEVTTATISLDEYVFQDLGPAQVVVKDINNSASSVIFSINVVPEFPVLGATVALLGVTFALAAARFAKTKSGSLT